MSYLKSLLFVAAIFTGLATHALAGSSPPRSQPAAVPEPASFEPAITAALELSGTCLQICIQQCEAQGHTLPSCVVPCKAQCGI